MDWYWLNKKRKKYGLGYVSIQKNKSVAEYLHTDFFKDHEWIIPYNIRHVRNSRDIFLRNWCNVNFKAWFRDGIKTNNIKEFIMKMYGIDIETSIVNYWINKQIEKNEEEERKFLPPIERYSKNRKGKEQNEEEILKEIYEDLNYIPNDNTITIN